MLTEKPGEVTCWTHTSLMQFKLEYQGRGRGKFLYVGQQIPVGASTGSLGRQALHRWTELKGACLCRRGSRMRVLRVRRNERK